MAKEETLIKHRLQDPLAPLLGGGTKDWRVQGLWGSAKAYCAARLFLASPRTTLVLCTGRQEAEDWQENLRTCLQALGTSSIHPRIFEGWEISSVWGRPSLENAAERSAVLENFLTGDSSAAQSAQLVVATLSGALQKLLDRQQYRAMRQEVALGDRLDRDDFIRTLTEWGYERVFAVEKKGDFSVHGGIVDVYPVAQDNPLRVELSGDVVESLRFFDVLSQRSSQATDKAVIHAANEWKILQGASGGHWITEFLPKHALILFDEPLELAAADDRMGAQEGLIPMPRMRFKEFLQVSRGWGRLAFSALPQTLSGWEKIPVWQCQSQSIETAVGQARQTHSVDALAHDAAAVLGQVQQWLQEGYVGNLVFHNEGEESRFFQWCKEQRLDAPWLKALRRVQGQMSAGFASSTFHNFFLTDQDIFGRARIRRNPRRFHGTSPIGQFMELRTGDLVVHQRHGIGRYLGVQKITPHPGPPLQGGRERLSEGEYLSIEYANKAKLHVPLDQAYLVGKYIGIGDRPVKLDVLGSKRWEATKTRVLSATARVAKELLEVQAARKALQRAPYGPDTPWQKDFEVSFPYEETPDQATSITQVKQDMESPQPMDRLLCGDVGYGKTEVAIRAAFKAVMNHRQVAVLVPTTILAQQHYATFSARMAEYPIRVQMLSRFRHPGQARKILLDLVEGKIDILIGTHRLLQRDVQFKDLGLVIIDEEQRFGVRHKEAFKKLRRLIDVLTLTATPIPRTLYLSLLGTREMSNINTPPEDRLPVETVLAEYSEDLIRRAIRHELAREGQVYFVHNRVQTIEKVRQTLARLIPEASMACAHGQMDEDLLSEIMSQFVSGKIQVLVTTTIIESGLDIPNANTLIVDRADRFGLSELYQLRGRVGRFRSKAYAYFLLPREKVLLEAAKKRLKAIADFTALGSGFKIAMRDLEIRGAGNILGHQQHGHIVAVGFDLYCQLLKQSLARMQNMPMPTDEEVTLKIGADLIIPPEYVPSEAMRLDLYRRISAATQQEPLQELAEEIQDRFGALPEAVRWLLEIGAIRILARRKGVFFLESKQGKWYLQRGKEILSAAGQLPRSSARNTVGALAEVKNLLRKLPDADKLKPS